MSGSNGVIRIGRKGRLKFALGDGEAFEIDVVAVYNQFYLMREGFLNEKREIATEHLEAWGNAQYRFVAELSHTTDLTMAEVFEFLARLGEEKEKLAVFFTPKSLDEPPLPERTEVRFALEE